MKRLSILFLAMAGLSAFAQREAQQLDSLFSAYFPPWEPGAAIAIQAGDHSLLSRGYGLADLHPAIPVATGTNFNIGSLTKQFTAYCILQLAAEKRLSLDDTLIKFFPGMTTRSGRSVTIRQLLTHSSGIIDHYAYAARPGLKHATDIDVLKAIEKKDSSYFPPGTVFRYSNTAYCLLALIIEKCSGLSYPDYLKRKVFLPLGMTQSTVWTKGQPIARRAYGYDTSGPGKKFVRLDADESVFFSTRGDGGVYTSIRDYLRWLHALDAGDSALRALAALSITPRIPTDSSGRTWYGYGWFISGSGKDQAIFHTGSNGGFLAISFRIPARHLAIVILSNRDDLPLEKIIHQVLEILHIPDIYFTNS